MHKEQRSWFMRRQSFKLVVLVLSALGAAGSILAQTWTNAGLPLNIGYSAVACSADGTVLIVGANIRDLLVSTNSGGNWTTNLFIGPWYCVACSADGTHLFGGTDWEGGAGLYISTNSGLTWTTNTAAIPDQIACSADGARVAVAAGGQYLYYSTNTGATFVTYPVPAPPGELLSVVCSADGTQLVAMPGTVNPADLGGPYYIYRWVASSATWLPITPVRGRWSSLATSADGRVLAAASYFGTAISTNSGATWVTNAGPRSWVIACSTDGTRMVAAQGGNGGTAIFTSLDTGQTWTSNNAPAFQWTGVCMSADGSFMVASTLGGGSSGSGVYVAHLPAQPSLAIAQCGTNLSLSWPLPSAGFVLQQSADITSTNWASVTNGVTPTNYWNQVTLSPPAAGNAFYRLVNP